VPLKGDKPQDATFVVGVNQQIVTPPLRRMSNASGTANCVDPLAKVLPDRFGSTDGRMTAVAEKDRPGHPTLFQLDHLS
jgi:glyceraldehyde-3-phosphate dehydrogenase/erythrose-4-phosphate dehydrogenase